MADPHFPHSELRHWLIVYSGGGRPVVTYSETDANMMRSFGHRIEGPFAPGAVEALEQVRDALIDPEAGTVPPVAEEAWKLADDALSRCGGPK